MSTPGQHFLLVTYILTLFTTPEGGSWGYHSVLSLQITHPAQESRVSRTTGVYFVLLLSNSGVGSFTSHKAQISDSAVDRDLRFFLLTRED